MTEEQARQMIELLQRIADSQDRVLDAIQTLAGGLNTNLGALTTTVDDIEQGVEALVGASNQEAPS